MGVLYELGQFRLNPELRVLTHKGVAVALGARAVAVLTTLVTHANEYVSKAAILDAAWPGLVVEENNLAAQISAIRRTLSRVPGGEGWIETLARRGYRFVGPVLEVAGSLPTGVTDRTRTNLPERLTSFVGRERELVEIKQLLPTTRLLTLTGAGGIGKTRLAQQLASEVLDAYHDGVWFVDLAPLANPTLVPSALAQALQVQSSAEQAPVSALCDRLRMQEALVIVDNCEHLLEACARMADVLLRETSKVTVIATSRGPLRHPAEHTFLLAPLPLPRSPQADLQRLLDSEAVQLFVERAQQHRPHFDMTEQRIRAVAEICVRLDGIPLALELAAARVAVLSVEQIVRLLDQRFRLLVSGSSELPRHQTLRAMLDWSYELLEEAEKVLLARLSVFAGGWTIAAAEAIAAGDQISKDDFVFVLIQLVEKSLVVADEDGDRYRLLETVREYAKSKLLESSGAEGVRQRHRDFFLALAEEPQDKNWSGDRSAWLLQLEQEHDNLRSALDWCLIDSGSSSGLRFCWALVGFWWPRGHFSEGRQWCARILAESGGQAQTRERANALIAAGVLAYFQSDYSAARAAYEESLAIQRHLDDRRGISFSLGNLGLVACDQRDYVSARALHTESLAIQRELGDRKGVANSLNNLANVAFELGEPDRAKILYEESLAITRDLADREGVARILGNLGEVARYQCDMANARALHEESLAIKQELGHRQLIARSLISLGDLASDQGDLASAQAHYGECLAIQRELGDRLAIANSLAGVASVVARLGNPLRAACIWGAAEQRRAEIKSPIAPMNLVDYERKVEAARVELGSDAAFDRSWQEGRTMSIAQVIDFALGASTNRQ